MKMNVQQGSPAPTSATMPWAPIIAPAPKASPSPLMEELVKVFIHSPESNGHISAKVMTVATYRECVVDQHSSFLLFCPLYPSPPHLATDRKTLILPHTAFMWVPIVTLSLLTSQWGEASRPLLYLSYNYKTKEVVIKNLSKLHNPDSTLGTLTKKHFSVRH